MLHCPGMDLTGMRDIFSHFGTVPGNPGLLVTLALSATVDSLTFQTLGMT